MAGPTGITEERMEVLAECFGAGLTQIDAAGAIGVHPSLLNRWLRMGEADAEHGRETVYARLHTACAMRKSLRRKEVLHTLSQHADWRAKLEWLRRTGGDYRSVDGLPVDTSVDVDRIGERIDDAREQR